MNEWINECFYYRVIKNWLKANLVLHTRQLKEDNEQEGWLSPTERASAG